MLRPILFLVYIDDLEEGVTVSILKCQMTLSCSEKLRKLEINNNYKMTLIKYSGGLKNGRCYSMLVNVNVYTQGLETLA